MVPKKPVVEKRRRRAPTAKPDDVRISALKSMSFDLKKSSLPLRDQTGSLPPSLETCQTAPVPGSGYGRTSTSSRPDRSET
jgi:hypothetical protein